MSFFVGRPVGYLSGRPLTRSLSDESRRPRDLFEAIERGEHPSWRVCVQIWPEEDALTDRLDPFDVTKVWPHRDYPLIEFAELVLDRNPQNYFAEIEQAAFEPSSIVPGVGQIQHFLRADPAYGEGVARGLGVVLEKEKVTAS